VLCQRVIDGRRVGRDVGMRCRVGTMSLATSRDIMRSGAGGVRRHSTEGVAEERRGGGSRSGGQTGVGSGGGRRAGVRSVRGSPYTYSSIQNRMLGLLRTCPEVGRIRIVRLW